MSNSSIEGKYQLAESHHFDEFLQALGVPANIRKRTIVHAPMVEITRTGEKMTIKQESLVKTSRTTFTLGEQFQEKTVEGKTVMSTISETAPNVLAHERLGVNGGKDSVCVREFTPAQMKCTCMVDDIVSTRVYDRM